MLSGPLFADGPADEYFAERAARGDLKKALQVLKQAGKGNPPLPGDELPAKTPRRRR
jgi:hypothetical protein